MCGDGARIAMVATKLCIRAPKQEEIDDGGQ
jgi:hypothetical protein